MPIMISDDEKSEFLHFFTPPLSWSRIKSDEFMRWWHVMLEEPGRILLRNGSGAVGRLRLEDGTIVEVELLEGPGAESLLREHAFQPSDEARRRVEKSFRHGKPLDELLEQLRGLRLAEVWRPTGETPPQRRYRLSNSAIVEFELGPNSKLQSYRWHVGGAALDILTESAAAKRWDVPAFPQNPIDARTRTEAELYLAVQRAEEVEHRLTGGFYQVLARIPEGLRLFSFHILKPSPDESNDLGSGHSSILDPTDYILFASRVERELPGSPSRTTTGRQGVYLKRLRLGASGLRALLGLIPDSLEHPPIEACTSLASRMFRKRHPGRYRRQAVQSAAEGLELLALLWEEEMQVN